MIYIENTAPQVDLSTTYTRPANTYSYTTQHATAKSVNINQPTPEEKSKAKETLIIAEVGGGLAYTANVYVLSELLIVTNPEIAAGVVSVLVAVKLVGLAYCAYGWLTT